MISYMLVSKCFLWDGHFCPLPKADKNSTPERRKIMPSINGLDYKIKEMSKRIRELREIEGLTVAEMALKT